MKDNRRRRALENPASPRPCWTASTRMPRGSIVGPPSTMWPCHPIAQFVTGPTLPDVHDGSRSLGGLAGRVSGDAPWRWKPTGVYWIPVFEILEACGFEVLS